MRLEIQFVGGEYSDESWSVFFANSLGTVSRESVSRQLDDSLSLDLDRCSMFHFITTTLPPSFPPGKKKTKPDKKKKASARNSPVVIDGGVER